MKYEMLMSWLVYVYNYDIERLGCHRCVSPASVTATIIYKVNASLTGDLHTMMAALERQCKTEGASQGGGCAQPICQYRQQPRRHSLQ